MLEFMALVVVIIATIYVFIKVKNSLQNKGKSKLSSISLAFVSSFFAFIVFMVLASSFFEDSKKQTQVQKAEQKIESIQKEVKPNEKIEAISITPRITMDIVSSLKDNYNIEAGIFEDMPLYLDKLCSSDTACQIYAGKTQIQVVYKTVEALTSSRVTPQYYQNVCSAILLGLTDANKDLVEDIIFQAFDYASKNGSSQTEVMGVKITVEPKRNNYNLLSCEFYQY